MQKYNLSSELFNYSDSFHLKKVLSNNNFNEFILNSQRHLLIFLNESNKELKFDLIYLNNLENQFEILKNISFDFISCYLTYLKYLVEYNTMNTSTSKNYISIKEVIDLQNKISKRDMNLNLSEEKNIHILRNHCVDFFYFLNDNEQYVKAKAFLDECKLDSIFIVFLLKKYLYSKHIEKLLEYILINEKFLEYDSYSESFIKNDKEMGAFLKIFFNKIISVRNEIKLKMEKVERKKICFESN